MTTPTLQQPYLITSWKFPNDVTFLVNVLSKMYFDIATAVNYRTIGVYDRFEAITGNSYYNDVHTNKRRQSYRQIYTLTALPDNDTTPIPLGFTVDANTQFVQLYAIATSFSTNFTVTIPFVNLITPTDGISIEIDRTNNNIQIKTTTANWVTYSAFIVVEYILAIP